MEETTTQRIERELKEVRAKCGGLLRAEDVVKYARNPKRALHKKFCWDDTEAAKRYRLSQAREVIRVYVTVHDVPSRPVRAWVSLREDRVKPGGGYRPIQEVLNDDELRASLLTEAKAELTRVAAKYRDLQELAGVFAAIEAIPELPLKKAATG